VKCAIVEEGPGQGVAGDHLCVVDGVGDDATCQVLDDTAIGDANRDLGSPVPPRADHGAVVVDVCGGDVDTQVDQLVGRDVETCRRSQSDHQKQGLKQSSRAVGLVEAVVHLLISIIGGIVAYVIPSVGTALASRP
jgi:hypothetical protein